METMRASSKTRGIIPVVVVELGVIDAEVLSAWRDDTMWAGIVESLLSDPLHQAEMKQNLSDTAALLGKGGVHKRAAQEILTLLNS